MVCKYLSTVLIFSFIFHLGKAVKQTTSGECEEREYLNGVLDGEATVIFPDGSKEIRTYAVITWLKIEKLIIGRL